MPSHTQDILIFTIWFYLSCRYKWYHYTININWPITT